MTFDSSQIVLVEEVVETETVSSVAHVFLLLLMMVVIVLVLVEVIVMVVVVLMVVLMVKVAFGMIIEVRTSKVVMILVP